MKLLIVGAFWNGSLEESYAQAFAELGFEVVRFDWDRSVRSFFWGKASERMLPVLVSSAVGEKLERVAKAAKPELILVIKGRFILPETIRHLKSILGGSPLINFNPDSPWEPANSSKYLLASISEYDVHFTWNRSLIEKFRGAGAKAVEYLPFGYDPKLHFPIAETMGPKELDAIFIGTFDSHRDKLLSTLHGCKIGIYGNGWERATHVPKKWIASKAVYGVEATKQLSRAYCALNILRPQNAGSHNMRTYEITATAHLLLTTRSAEQSELFAEGEEMLCYESPNELFAAITEIRENPERATAIAGRGYERVKEETYVNRARGILSVLGLQGLPHHPE